MCIRDRFYNDVDALLLVYDTTNFKTYYNLVKWMLEVYTACKHTKAEFLRKVPTLIVGMKLDLAPKKDQPNKLQDDWKINAVYFGKTHTTDQIRNALRSFWSGETHQSGSEYVRRRRVSDKYS